MYALVGEFRVSWNINTVPLTQFSCNAVFSRNQNARKWGNRCILSLLIRHREKIETTRTPCVEQKFSQIEFVYRNRDGQEDPKGEGKKVMWTTFKEWQHIVNFPNYILVYIFPSISYYFHIPKNFLNFFPHTGKNRNRRKSNLLP